MRWKITLLAVIAVPIVYIGLRTIFDPHDMAAVRAMFMGIEVAGIIILQTWLPRRMEINIKLGDGKKA